MIMDEERKSFAIVVAVFLIILSVLALALGIAHVVRAGENVYNFLFNSHFKIKEYHKVYDECDSHGLETEEAQHHETVWANLKGDMVLKNPFFCFTAKMVRGLAMICLKFTVSAVLFWAAIANVNAKNKIADGGRYSLILLALDFLVLFAVRWFVWLRVVISAIKYTANWGSFWNFAKMVLYSLRVNLYPIALLIAAIACVALLVVFFELEDKIEYEKNQEKDIYKKLKKLDAYENDRKEEILEMEREEVSMAEISIEQPTVPFIEY